MKKILVFIGCLLALSAIAAVLQSGWTSTTNPATARTALGAAGLTNNNVFTGSNNISGAFTGSGAGLTNTPTGMQTNTFTRFVDGGWQLFTNIADGSLCFSNLTYPQFVLMLRTNGSLLLTNATTGASNVMSAAGWTAMSGALSNNSVRILDGHLRVANSVIRMASPSTWDFYNTASAMETISVASRRFSLTAGGLKLPSDFVISIGANAGTGAADGSAAQDTGLSRDSAGWWQLNNGTAGNISGNIKGASAIFNNTVTATNGIASFASVASTAIDATGWTNIWSTNNAVVVFGGTTVSSWKKRAGALTATNITYPLFTGNQTVILQPGQAIVISGTGVTGSADPF